MDLPVDRTFVAITRARRLEKKNFIFKSVNQTVLRVLSAVRSTAFSVRPNDPKNVRNFVSLQVPARSRENKFTLRTNKYV